MASFLSMPPAGGEDPKSRLTAQSLGPMPDFSLDLTTESFLENDVGQQKELDDSPEQKIPKPSYSKSSPPLLQPDPDLCLTPDKPERPAIIRIEKHKHVRFDVPQASQTDTEENKENITGGTFPGEGSKTYSYVKKDPVTKKNFDNNDNVLESDKNGIHIFAKMKGHDAPVLPKAGDGFKSGLPIRDSNKPALPKVPSDYLEEAPAPRTVSQNSKVYFPRPLPKDTKPGVVLAEEHVFQRPEFLSTLKVTQEMKNLKLSKLDVEKAVENKLLGSPMTRNNFIEKTTCRVNPLKLQYRALESTDIHVPEDIIKQKEIQRKSLIKGPNMESTRIQDSRFQEPKIMDLFTPNLQVEMWSQNIDSLPKFEEPLRTAPSNTAFELYHHLRIWEDLP